MCILLSRRVSKWFPPCSR